MIASAPISFPVSEHVEDATEPLSTSLERQCVRSALLLFRRVIATPSDAACDAAGGPSSRNTSDAFVAALKLIYDARHGQQCHFTRRQRSSSVSSVDAAAIAAFKAAVHNPRSLHTTAVLLWDITIPPQELARLVLVAHWNAFWWSALKHQPTHRAEGETLPLSPRDVQMLLDGIVETGKSVATVLQVLITTIESRAIAEGTAGHRLRYRAQSFYRSLGTVMLELLTDSIPTPAQIAVDAHRKVSIASLRDAFEESKLHEYIQNAAAPALPVPSTDCKDLSSSCFRQWKSRVTFASASTWSERLAVAMIGGCLAGAAVKSAAGPCDAIANVLGLNGTVDPNVAAFWTHAVGIMEATSLNFITSMVSRNRTLSHKD